MQSVHRTDLTLMTASELPFLLVPRTHVGMGHKVGTPDVRGIPVHRSYLLHRLAYDVADVHLSNKPPWVSFGEKGLTLRLLRCDERAVFR